MALQSAMKVPDYHALEADSAMQVETLPLRILLIEDNSSDALFVKHELKHHLVEQSLSVISVSTMFAALEMLGLAHFHLAILDLNLLDIEGSASVSALHSQVPDLPIIVYSGSDDPKLREEAFLCGAKYYLIKGKANSYGLAQAVRNELIHLYQLTADTHVTYTP